MHNCRTQHSMGLTIFCLNLQANIIAQILSIGGERNLEHGQTDTYRQTPLKAKPYPSRWPQYCDTRLCGSVHLSAHKHISRTTQQTSLYSLHVPGPQLWAVSEVSLSTLYVVGNGRPDSSEQGVDSEDRHYGQRHGDNDREPEQCRGAEHAERGAVLGVQ